MDHNDTPTAPENLAGLTDHGPLQAVVRSFGFGHAAPDADGLVVDLRRFRNVPLDEGQRNALVAGTGLDNHVRDYVLDTPGMRAALEEVADQAAALVAWAHKRGQFVVIQLGCTGGRHRSVAGAEHVAAILRARGITTEVEHRDVEKPVIRPAAPAGPSRADRLTRGAGLAAMVAGLAGLVLAVAAPALVGGWVFPLVALAFAVGYVWTLWGPHTPTRTDRGPWWDRLQVAALAVGGTAALVGMLTTDGGVTAPCTVAAWVGLSTLPGVLAAALETESTR